MLYVDKTSYINSLVKNKGKYYFLARHRRFGKSLFLDTLAEYFKGNRGLFNRNTVSWDKITGTALSATRENYWRVPSKDDYEESGFYDAEIVSIKDNSNIVEGILKYRCCNGSSINHKIELIKELVETPSGEYIEEWRINDYDGKKR